MGILWIIFGGVLTLYLTLNLFLASLRFNHDFIWYIVQSIFPAFGVLSALFGVYVLKESNFAIAGVIILSVLAMVYFALFIIMGAHNGFDVFLGVLFVSFFMISLQLATKISKDID